VKNVGNNGINENGVMDKRQTINGNGGNGENGNNVLMAIINGNGNG
jgi:hypothetical protein